MQLPPLFAGIDNEHVEGDQNDKAEYKPYKLKPQMLCFSLHISTSLAVR